MMALPSAGGSATGLSATDACGRTLAGDGLQRSTKPNVSQNKPGCGTAEGHSICRFSALAPYLQAGCANCVCAPKRSSLPQACWYWAVTPAEGPIASCRPVRSGQRGPAIDTRYPHKRDGDAECARVLLARNIQPLWLGTRQPSTLSPCLLVIKSSQAVRGGSASSAPLTGSIFFGALTCRLPPVSSQPAKNSL